MAETRALLNYGFRFFQTIQPVSPEISLGQHRVWKGELDKVDGGVLDPIVITVPRSNKEPDLRIAFNEPLSAPINRGDSIGTLTVIVDDEVVIEQSLLALNDVPAAGFFARLWDGFLLWLSSLFGAS